jgi:hypothetical protein
VFNPGLNEDVHSISQLLFYATMAAFVLVGGHRDVVAALLDSFVAMPPGAAAAPEGSLDAMTALLGQSFVLGVRAAPALTALLFSTVVRPDRPHAALNRSPRHSAQHRRCISRGFLRRNDRHGQLTPCWKQLRRRGGTRVEIEVEVRHA